jgi:hypothetical protein
MLSINREDIGLYGSDNDEERSLLLEFDILIHDDNFLVLAVMDYFCAHIVEVEGLADLVSEFAVDWHRF